MTNIVTTKVVGVSDDTGCQADYSSLEEIESISHTRSGLPFKDKSDNVTKIQQVCHSTLLTRRSLPPLPGQGGSGESQITT